LRALVSDPLTVRCRGGAPVPDTRVRLWTDLESES
jgi:hypothetical protein